MDCPYCNASNTSDDHRCQRCGRRLDDGGNPYSRPAYGRGATALALNTGESESVRQDCEPARRTAPTQSSLFSTPVVSFQSYSPESVELPRAKSASRGRRAKRPIPGQESFSFETVITPAEVVSKGPEPAICCDACVATPAHRVMAAAIDLSVVIVAVALFLLIFSFAGGEPLLIRHTLPFCAAATAVFYLLYELLWCFAETDTAGMRGVRQRLVNFDGRRPTRRQRVARMWFGCLSLLAGGLGILWALVDEESLTWHDHMSSTFPSPF